MPNDALEYLNQFRRPEVVEYEYDFQDQDLWKALWDLWNNDDHDFMSQYQMDGDSAFSHSLSNGSEVPRVTTVIYRNMVMYCYLPRGSGDEGSRLNICIREIKKVYSLLDLEPPAGFEARIKPTG